MNKKDKPITGIEHKYEILKQFKSNIDNYKICIPKWNDINRINPSKMWNKENKNKKYIKIMWKDIDKALQKLCK